MRYVTTLFYLTTPLIPIHELAGEREGLEAVLEIHQAASFMSARPKVPCALEPSGSCYSPYADNLNLITDIVLHSLPDTNREDPSGL